MAPPVSNSNSSRRYPGLNRPSGLCPVNRIFPAGFGDASTYEDLVNGDCTSCAVVQDKSAYWAPILYFKHLNGSFEEVQQVGGMLA